MNCAYCDNLDPKKKVPGKVSGNLYYCKKLKTFVNPTMKGCEKYTKSKRKYYESDDMLREGREYNNDIIPNGLYLAILIILIIIGLIFGLFK